MSFEFNEKEIKDFITMSPESEELAALEEEYLRDYDEEEPVWSHKLELEDLEELLGVLATVKAEFDPKVHAREAAERAYATAIYLTYHLARRFHPLTSYGKGLLRKAYRLREEYEKTFHAPMVTGIDATNCEAFRDVISEDVLEAISVGAYKGLGVFRTDVDRLVPVAAAAYEWREYPAELEEDPEIDVKWLYVDEQFRGMKVADFLIGELVTLMIRKGASSLSLSVPVDEYYETWLQLFAEWKFEVSTGLNPEFRIGFADIPDNARVYVFNDSATPLAEITEQSAKQLVRGFMKASGDSEIYSKATGRGSYYDPDLCCFTGTETAPTGLLLAHRKPSGEIAIEYVGYGEKVGEDVLAMMGKCISSAKAKYEDLTDFILYPDSEEFEKFLDKFVPDPKVVPMLHGELTEPFGVDITERFVDKMMEQLEP